MSYPDGMQFRSSNTRSPYHSTGAMRNYLAAVSQDAEIAEEIRELITHTEKQVNAKLSRVNDRSAFDTDELDCLFCRLGEALPNRTVLERRAGL